MTSQASLIQLIREDYRSHGSDWRRPGFRALATYRFGVWRMQQPSRLVRGVFGIVYRMLYRRCTYLYGIEIPYAATIGHHVIFEHQHGIVVHGNCVIGDRCIIRQGVTLGIRDESDLDAAPILGRGVSVGAGAKVLGRVTIGDGAKIGANAVVLRNVPAGATAVGIPARNLCNRDTDANGSNLKRSHTPHVDEVVQ